MALRTMIENAPLKDYDPSLWTVAWLPDFASQYSLLTFRLLPRVNEKWMKVRLCSTETKEAEERMSKYEKLLG
jgi:hypothetical protein